jgi:Tol biopolymer transport system component
MSGKGLAHLLFLRDTTLMAQPFDPGKLELVGDPSELLQQASSSATGPQVAASIASNGMLIYAANVRGQNQLTWLDRSGNELGKAGPPGMGGIALSPDGNTLAFQRQDQPGTFSIWLYSFARGSESLFQSVAARPGAVWSPAGDRIVYAAPVDGPSGLLLKPADGSGAEELLLPPGANLRAPSDWSRDGNYARRVSAEVDRRVSWALTFDEVPTLQTGGC